MKPLKSIMKNSSLWGKQTNFLFNDFWILVKGNRQDRFGTDIHNSRQKISFRDKVEAQSRVCDVYLVESYKKYNADTSNYETPYCKCVSLLPT